jgi:hypothetical protein
MTTFRPAALSFNNLHKYLNESYIFSNIYYHIKLEVPKLSDAYMATTSEVRTEVMFLLFMVRKWNTKM